MRTRIEYKNDILFIKIIGFLVGGKIDKFEMQIIPIILLLEIRKVVINMKNVVLIDRRGVESIIKISNIVNGFKGKTVLCDLNEYLKINFKHSDIYDYCYKSKDEKNIKWVFN